jgi:hypothetical protein
MLEPDVISRIRHIFLHPRPHVSIMQATALLGWSRRRMSEAIEEGEVELWTTPVGKWFPRAEMMAKALEIWPMHVIEEALGRMRTGSCRRRFGVRSCGCGCRGITSTCWSIGRTSRRRRSAVCWSGSWTALPVRISRSCRRRCRGSPRRWPGRLADEKPYPQMTQMGDGHPRVAA